LNLERYIVSPERLKCVNPRRLRELAAWVGGIKAAAELP
jgi:hypothetical protein